MASDDRLVNKSGMAGIDWTRLGDAQDKAASHLKATAKVGKALSGLQQKYLDEVRAELARREAVKGRGHSMPSYVNDPVGFVKTFLNEEPWSIQRRIMESVRDNRRTAVPSCHDSGKSYSASRIAAWWLSTHEPGEAFCISSAPTTAQVKAILWREINKAHARGKLPGRMNQTEWFMGTELVGFGRKPDDADLSAFQGIHARYVLVVLDEATGIVKQLWDAADTLITNEHSRILAIGNPDDPTAHFATVCKPGSGWNVIPISAFDTPNFTGEPVSEKVKDVLVSQLWVEEKKTSWGEESPLWKAKVLGQFPDIGENTLIGPGLVRQAQEREMKPEYPIELGVDIARYGTDSTIITLRRGNVYTVHKKLHGQDLMSTTGEIIRVAIETGATAIKVDDIGLGGGVTDALKERAKQGYLSDCKIYGINVGRAASGKKSAEKFLNLRAELYWNLKEMFVMGDIKIPDDDKLASQLSSIRYEVDSRGRIKIESKDDMKKRGMHSPDEADSLMLAAAGVATFEAPTWMTEEISSPKIAIFGV